MVGAGMNTGQVAILPEGESGSSRESRSGATAGDTLARDVPRGGRLDSRLPRVLTSQAGPVLRGLQPRAALRSGSRLSPPRAPSSPPLQRTLHSFTHVSADPAGSWGLGASRFPLQGRFRFCSSTPRERPSCATGEHPGLRRPKPRPRVPECRTLRGGEEMSGFIPSRASIVSCCWTQ